MRSLRPFLCVSLIVFGSVLSGCGEKSAPSAVQKAVKPATEQELATILKRADAGNADAQLRLGLMYHVGRGVSKDVVMAANWYQKAAAQGKVEAQNRLGAMYLEGVGVPKDPAVGIEWLQKAATQGDAVAQNWLGYIYREGHGVPKNDAKAAEWLQKAAAQGLATAQNDLAEMYSTGTGVPKDAAKAVAWLQKAAAQGDAVAQQNLASMYVKGEGVPQDAAKAAEWLRKAAAQGLAVSQNNLGAMYGTGEGVPQDAAKALEWYQKAAAQGHATAQYNLAGMYARGEGVPKDLVMAYAWVSLAATQGHADSVRDLRRAEGLLSKGELQEAQRLSANWKKGQLLSRVGGSSTAQPVSPGGKFDTVADAVLTNDIVTSLSTAHKIYHPECKEAKATSAKTISVTREKASEEWVMSGCGETYAYTVELIPDGKGGNWISIPRGAPDPSVAQTLGCKALPTSPGDWVKVDEDNESAIYANVKSIRKNGEIVAIWAMSDYKSIQTAQFGKFWSFERLYEVDCKANQRRLISQLARADKMARGEVVWCDGVAYEWKAIRQGTMGETLRIVACGPASSN